LMVLQALRGVYPRATFFSTDLDARLVDPGNLRWTRQLLIASSLGFSLRPCLQQGTPPFRDTYQSTTYFSTVLAMQRFLGGVHSASGEGSSMICPHAPGSEQADDPAAGLQWAAEPRLFEIGRSQAFDLTRDPQQPTDCNLNGVCLSIAAPQSLSILSNSSPLYGFVWGLVMLVIAMLMAWSGMGTDWVLSLFAARKRAGDPSNPQIRRALAIALLLVLSVGCTWVWPTLVNEFTDGKTRAPSAILGGASLWAACVVELLSILAVLTLVIRGQRKLDENAEDLHRRFGFMGTPQDLARSHARQLKNSVSRLREMLQVPGTRRPRGAALAIGGQLSQVETLIARYLYRGTPGARALRVSLATLIAASLLIGLELILQRSLIGVADLFELGSPSAHSADFIAAVISLISLVFMLFLILWVADALLLSRSFLLELLKDEPQWPAAATKKVWQELRLPNDQAELWLDLELTSTRTNWVTELIWYPSLVILFMILAALSVEFGQFGFANNPTAIALSVIVVVAAALLLRNAAESWRDAVRKKLEDARLRDLSPDAGSRAEARQLKDFLRRVEDLSVGAFAPLSAQPFVRAVLIPLATYGATAILGYFHLSS
jgi:hypothetical protein